jgi:hypothetical protein
MNRIRRLTLVLMVWGAIAWLPAARADVVVTLFNGNAAGAGSGNPSMDFSGLPQVTTFRYYAPAFGVDASAGGTTNNWTPFGLSTNFSARITGQINVAANGSYTFSTRSDDGSILKIDGNVVVNNNFNQGPTTRTGTVQLAAGIHNVEIDYNQMGGGRSLDVGSGSAVNALPTGVTWVENSPTVQVNTYNGMRFDPNTGALVDPTTPLVGTLLAPAINFESATGNLWSPFGLQTNYSVDILGTIHVNADGTYDFGLNSDDGSFLYIDGQQLINNGGFHGPTTVDGSEFLTAGDHSIEVEMFQGGGGAGVDLTLPAGVTITTPAPAVPEPGSFALLVSGGCFWTLGLIRRRRKDAA